MSENGTGMASTPNDQPSGAVTTAEATRKNPSQGKIRSGISNKKTTMRIDTNRHGIRRETVVGAPKKNLRPKKV